MSSAGDGGVGVRGAGTLGVARAKKRLMTRGRSLEVGGGGERERLRGGLTVDEEAVFVETGEGETRAQLV